MIETHPIKVWHKYIHIIKNLIYIHELVYHHIDSYIPTNTNFLIMIDVKE